MKQGNNENPQSEADSQVDAAALFNELASKDSNDSAQDGDDNRQDEGEELQSNNDSEESNQDSEHQGQDDDDPWLSVDEELRNQHYALQANHNKLQNDHKANSGRVQALNNKVKELTELTKKSEQEGGEQASNMPTAEDLEGKSFDEVEEEWPEIAGYLKKQLDGVTKQFEQRLSPFEQQRSQAQQRQHIEHELNSLAKVHPDFREISSDTRFHSWVNTQPDTVKSMAQSTHAADNIALLNLYKGSGQYRPKPKGHNLADHAVIPKKGSGRQVQVDPSNIDPVKLFNQLASKKG